MTWAEKLMLALALGLIWGELREINRNLRNRKK